LDQADACARFRDIDLHKTVDVMLSCREVHAIDNHLPKGMEGLNGVWSICHWVGSFGGLGPQFVE
jgi:hypothetical protein